MSDSYRETCASKLNWRLVTALIVATVAILFVGANTHLVYVALGSQPDCVPHEKAAVGEGAYRAAKSAC